MSKGLRNTLLGVAIVLVLSIMIISALGRNAVTFVEDMLGNFITPINKFFSDVGYFIDEKVEPFFNVMNYKQRNDSLEMENAALKEELKNLTLTRKEMAEYEELRALLKIDPVKKSSNYLTATVIAKDPGNWFNFITIDAGSDDGVKKNSAVINADGLVGLVYEVGTDWSKVVTIIDQRSSVAFEMFRVNDDFDGIVSGTKHFQLICEFYDPDATFAVGDHIMTSGMGIYPKGIMIGKIEEVLTSSSSLVKRARVEPAVDFRKLNKVMVIPYKGSL